METLLLKYGYLLLFVGVAVEGEAFLLAGSFLANRGYFHLPLVILVAVVANCTADQIYYLAARTRGRAWLDCRFGQSPRYRRMVELVSRHAGWLLLVSRFAFGLRIVIPAACGALGMRAGRFTAINLAAAVMWAVPTALIGFYFGRFAHAFLLGAWHYELWILAGFVLAGAAVVFVRHLRRSEWIEDLRPADIHDAVPFLMGLMGLLNLVSAIWPRSQASLAAVERWLPLEVMQGSRALMLFAGVALLQVTRNLRRRKQLAWYVAVAALGVSLLLHATHALDLHHSLVAGLLLGYLIVFRRRFHARSDPSLVRRGLLMAPVLGAVVFVYAWVGLRELASEFEWHARATPAIQALVNGILIGEPGLEPRTAHAARFLGSVQIAGWLARLYVLVLCLHPVIQRRRQEAAPEAVRRIFELHGSDSLAAFAVQEDKNHLVLCEGRALIAFATRGGVALACGDPLAPDAELGPAIAGYVAHCARNGWTPVIYEAAEAKLPAYRELGLRALKMAEEARIDLAEFTLSGNKRANLRAMVNKAAKSGLAVERYDRAAAPDGELDEQLEEVSEEWLRDKKLGELGFTMGRFSLDAITPLPVFVARAGGRVEAFCSWLPYRRGEAVVLDLMRRRTGAPAGTMDMLLAQALLALKAERRIEASLANAPLANVGPSRGGLDRGVALLFENLNAIYGYRNLFQFKKKFAPRWGGRYLVYPKTADLPRVALAVTRLHVSGGLRQLLGGRRA